MANRPPEEVQVIVRLCREDKEFEQLWQEHEQFDRRTAELEEQKFLTPEEEVELKRIKKLKLQGKDKIEARIRSCRAAPPA